MSGTREKYLKRMAPVDVRLKSGFTFRMRRMSAMDWGKVWGGLLVVSEAKAASAPAMDDAERHSQFKRRVFEHLVLGLVDEDTKELVAIAYEEVSESDLSELVDWQTDNKPDTSTEGAVGRAL